MNNSTDNNQKLVEKTIQMLQQSQEQYRKHLQHVVCLETGAVNTLPEWAKIVAQIRGIKPTSAYGLLNRAILKGQPYLGMTFRYLDTVDEEAIAPQEEELEMEEEAIAPPPPPPAQPVRQASPGMFRRQPQGPVQPQLTMHQSPQRRK